jgi:hypothetical protein
LRLQSGRIALGFEFIDQLIELIEIDAGSEPERVRSDFRDGALLRPRLFAETGPERSVDSLLERQPQFSGALLQQPGNIIVDGESSAHQRHHGC